MRTMFSSQEESMSQGKKSNQAWAFLRIFQPPFFSVQSILKSINFEVSLT